jgi:hypothetical protein
MSAGLKLSTGLDWFGLDWFGLVWLGLVCFVKPTSQPVLTFPKRENRNKTKCYGLISQIFK